MVQEYEEFYDDVHSEFLQFGEIVNFKVLWSSFRFECYKYDFWQRIDYVYGPCNMDGLAQVCISL